jgi:hypothetical protein
MNGVWKYIDPNTWELVTRVDGVVIRRTSDPKKIANHYNTRKKYD